MAVIMPRDEQLFYLMGQFRVMTLKQIRRSCYSGVTRPVVTRRLAKFRDAGLMYSTPYGISGENAWTLTIRGAEAAGAKPEIFRHHINRNCVQHDLCATDIGLAIWETGNLIQFRTANELALKKREGLEYPHIPDGRIFLKNPIHGKEMLELEIENSMKNDKKISHTILHYARTTIYPPIVLVAWRDRSLRDRFIARQRDILLDCAVRARSTEDELKNKIQRAACKFCQLGTQSSSIKVGIVFPG